MRTSLDLRQKDNLVKHQNFSKCYENDCLENFIFLFMFLLTTKLFYLSKKRPKTNLKYF